MMTNVNTQSLIFQSSIVYVNELVKHVYRVVYLLELH